MTFCLISGTLVHFHFPCFRLGIRVKLDFVKKASIVSIGDELLSGQTVSTNASYLSGRLLSMGIPVVSSYTIADDIDAMVRTFNLASSEADVVIATGGLGPTEDDLTRQGFAEFLGCKLQLQKELLQRIEDFFAGRGLNTPERNKVQAYIPTGAKALANNLGTACGIMAEAKDKLFIALPGVPAEMKQMFEESVLGELKKLAAGQAIVVRRLRCFGTGESNIAELLGPLMERVRNPLINCTADCGLITLTITATAKNKAEAQQMAEQEEKLLRNRLGELIYGTDQQTLAEVVGEKLARQKKTLAVAESCTGGTLAKLLTDIPGASRYFTFGWVTYSDSAKTGELGVPADLIEKHGSVSEQVARAMAKGARKRATADYAIAITGIAGPTGATEQKPVGLVYISIDYSSGTETRRFMFSGDRDSIRLRAARTALNMLRLKL